MRQNHASEIFSLNVPQLANKSIPSEIQMGKNRLMATYKNEATLQFFADSLKIINFRNIATKSKTLNTWQHFWMEALFWFGFDNNNICTFAYTVNYMNWLSFENETRRFGWRGNLFIRNANLICKQRIVKVRVKFCDTTLHIHISISLNN